MDALTSREEEPVYTSGVWTVKKGREEEFERRWQEAANGSSLEYPDVKFMLLRDREDPRRFVSLTEGAELACLPGFDGRDLARARGG
jgi:hypothetical protein